MSFRHVSLANFMQVQTRSPFIYRSKFGGVWIDRADSDAVLARKLKNGEIDADLVEPLRFYKENGYVVFPKAVSHESIDAYLRMFDQAWHAPPPGIYAHSGGQVLPMSAELYDRVAKVSDLHYYFQDAHRLIFPDAVLRFLSTVYERAPVVFQTMTMRKGSEESLHTDTGPLTLTEPMTLTAAWLALEDVHPDAGALQYVPGSHALPEVLNNGTSKGHNGDMGAYYKVLQEILATCESRGMKTDYFMAKKGDVLIWSADLMHGGAPINDSSRTRKSLVSHFMPLGVMPTFYDFSNVNYVQYPNGGWHLDRIKVA
jgi:phytanoyl-CoA hydroxylase